MTGKFTPDKSWNIIKTDGLFEIDGHAADSARKRNMAQNAIYCLVKDNEGIKQFEIADRLNKAGSNVNRDLKKLKRDGHITGTAAEGYCISKTS